MKYDKFVSDRDPHSCAGFLVSVGQINQVVRFK
jgi:hypothetical protein